MYNNQFLRELKSNKINYRNTKYYRLWNDVLNTYRNNSDSDKHNAQSHINHSIINLVYIIKNH